MPTNTLASLGKIINPTLALAALNSVSPHGEFKALVKMTKTKPYPASMKSVRNYAPGLLAALIPCSQIINVAADSNVISIELRELIA